MTKSRPQRLDCPRPMCTGTIAVAAGRVGAVLTCPVCGERVRVSKNSSQRNWYLRHGDLVFELTESELKQRLRDGALEPDVLLSRDERDWRPVNAYVKGYVYRPPAAPADTSLNAEVSQGTPATVSREVRATVDQSSVTREPQPAVPGAASQHQGSQDSEFASFLHSLDQAGGTPASQPVRAKPRPTVRERGSRRVEWGAVIAVASSLLIAIMIRLPSAVSDVKRYRGLAEEETLSRDACSPIMEAIESRGLLGRLPQLSEPPGREELTLVGRPLVMDRATRSLSSLHLPVSIWPRPLSPDERLTVFVIDERSPRTYPGFYAYHESGSDNTVQVDGFGEDATVCVVTYPDLIPVCRFPISATPREVFFDFQEVRDGDVPSSPEPSRAEFAFGDWYAAAFGEEWYDAAMRFEMEPRPEDDVVVYDRPQKSFLLSLGASPLEDFPTYVEPRVAFGLHLRRFLLMWFIAFVPCAMLWGTCRLALQMWKPSRKPVYSSESIP